VGHSLPLLLQAVEVISLSSRRDFLNKVGRLPGTKAERSKNG